MNIVVKAVNGLFELLGRLVVAMVASPLGALVLVVLVLVALTKVHTIVSPYRLQGLTAVGLLLGVIAAVLVARLCARMAERVDGMIAKNPKYLAKLRARAKWQHLP